MLNEHLPTNEDAKDGVVRKVRLQVESHLRAIDKLVRELQPEALPGTRGVFVTRSSTH